VWVTADAPDLSTAVERAADHLRAAARLAGHGPLVLVGAGLAWSAGVIRAGPPLPHPLEGELSVRPLGPGSCLLSLTGSYEPPLGALGRRLDEAMLRRAVDATVRDLATAIAARVAWLAASRPG
jgi:hypothetical protein